MIVRAPGSLHYMFFYVQNSYIEILLTVLAILAALLPF